jgi:ABC-type nitrate/sulfonate/bicarbonate transport system substrate-binding protein
MLNRTKILLIALISTAVIGTGYFLFGKDKKTDDHVTIRVLDSSTPSDWEIAGKLTGKDLLAESGVRLEKISLAQSSGGTISIQSLLANNIDYASSAWPAWINAIASGGKIKAVATGMTTSRNYPGNGLVVLENSSIRSVKQLSGKKIAVNVLGASADYEIRQYLRQNDLSIDLVELVVVPGPQIEQVLRSGQVDVAAWTMGGGLEYEIAMSQGGLRELPGTKRYDIRGETITMGSGFREDFITKHPDTVRQFVAVVEKSKRILWDEFQKDPERVKKAYAEITEAKGGNPKLARYYKPTFSPDYPFAEDKDIQWWIDILTTEGKLKIGQISPSAVYTNQYNPYFTSLSSHSVRKNHE